MIVLYIILSIIVLIFILLHFSVIADISFINNNFEVKVKYLFFTIFPLKEKKPKIKKTKKISKKKRSELEEELEKEKQAYNQLLEKSIKESLNNDSPQENQEKATTQQTEIEFEEVELKKQNKIPESNKKADKNDKAFADVEKKPSLSDKFNDLKNKWEEIKPYIPLGKKAFKKLLRAIRITGVTIDFIVADEDAYECAMNYGKINTAVYNTLAVLKVFLIIQIKRINISASFNSDKSKYDFCCKIKTRPSTLIAIAVIIFINFIYTNLKLKSKKGDVKNERTSD